MKIKWQVRKRKVTWNNGDTLILYDVGKYDKFLFWKTWIPGKDFNDEIEANDFCKILNDGGGIKEQVYMDGDVK